MQVIVWLFRLPTIAASLGFLAIVFSLLNVRRMAAADKRWAGAFGQPYFSQYGEALVGRWHVRRPFAHLTPTRSALRLAARWKDYEFPRASIERLGCGPGWWGGLAIQHRNPSYPSPVVFVSLNNEAVRHELEKLGYECER